MLFFLVLAVQSFVLCFLQPNGWAGVHPNAPVSIDRFETTLPMIHIQLGSGVGITDQPQNVKVTILDGASNSRAALESMAPQYFATIRIRGNGSKHFAKKQYALNLTTADYKDKASTELLGMPKHHKWVLSAPYIDRLMVRNSFAFQMGRSLSDSSQEPWYSPRSKAVELLIDGKYQGVYYLTEKIEVSKNRLVLEKPNYESDEKFDFLVKVEHKFWQNKREFFRSKNKSFVTFLEPDADKFDEIAKKDPRAAASAKKHVVDTFEEFEQAIRRIETGDFSYRKLIDFTSFQNFMFVQEITKNLDGYRRSLFLHSKNGKIHMGPIWDFDLSLASVRIFGQRNTYGFQVGHDRYIDGNNEVYWFRTMLKDKEFRRAFISRFKALRKPGMPLSNDVLLRSYESLTNEVGYAQARNFTVWDLNLKFSDGPVTWFAPKYKNFDYDHLVHAHKMWLLHRLAWLDKNINRIGRE